MRMYKVEYLIAHYAISHTMAKLCPHRWKLQRYNVRTSCIGHLRLYTLKGVFWAVTFWKECNNVTLCDSSVIVYTKMQCAKVQCILMSFGNNPWSFRFSRSFLKKKTFLTFYNFAKISHVVIYVCFGVWILFIIRR